jgi:hypothetical protein
MDGQNNTFGGPAVSHSPQPDLTADYRVLNKTGYFSYNYFLRLGKMKKLVFFYSRQYTKLFLKLSGAGPVLLELADFFLELGGAVPEFLHLTRDRVKRSRSRSHSMPELVVELPFLQLIAPIGRFQ